MNYDIFENKKIVVFLPHQDDEINIAYGLLEGLKDKNCLVKVVYSTNGDYVVKAKYRYKEAIDSLKLVGVSNENIIFMGYSDQATNNSTHLYHSNDAWVSNNGVKNTYSPLGNDYHYLHFGKHAEFNKENFIMDIYQILKEEQADFLICIDFDSHSDHRALSLSFEKALGQLMHENELYRPVVYKAFAYPTSYKGVSDFSVWNPSTKNNVEEFGLQPLENPYYSWSERVRFVQPKGARAFLLSKNIYFKGLLKHKSQYILNVYDKVINSDIVFFERKTNNLLFNASIETSSGDSSYLNDFMLFDCSDIMYGDSKLPLLDKGYTVFEKEDKKKSINVSFHKPSSFNCIKIYASLDEVKIDKIILLYNGKKEDVTPVFLNNTYIIKKEFDRIKDISLQFISSSLLKIGEIEILKENPVKNIYGKLLINDDFCYDCFLENDVLFRYYTNYDKDFLNIVKIGKKYVLKTKDGKILDEVHIKRNSVFNKLKSQLFIFLNKVIFFSGRVWQKIIKMKRKFFD